MKVTQCLLFHKIRREFDQEANLGPSISASLMKS